MANWGCMQPAAAEVWVPCDYQMAADWSMEPAAQVWVPGLPVEYQTSVLASSVQQQLVAYAAATEKSAAQDQFEVDIVKEMEVKIHDNPIRLFEETAQVFDSDIKKMEMKIHGYPSCIDSYLINRYSVPSTVAIGPRHHGSPKLQEAERVKHVAAYHCIKESGHSVQDMYDAVVLVTDYARSLYDEEVLKGIDDKDFQPMMFYDACFLVQYMISCTYDGWLDMDESLRKYFDSNEEAIFNDIMMLENQIPWKVVETLMKFRDVPLENVAAYAEDYLQDTKKLKDLEPIVLDDSYNPPHLLGFLRFYIVGGRRNVDSNQSDDLPDSISFSVNAIELAEIGITLNVSESKKLMDIGIKEGRHELSLPQVSLDDSRACILINMAALELCTVPNFHLANEEDSAVCSYLQLLAMMTDKEEDVQQLRREQVLQGGGGLTNQEVLGLFTSLQDLRPGYSYIRTMEQIEAYKRKSWFRVMGCKFCSRNGAAIVKVIGFVATLAGILGTIVSLKSG